MHVAIIIIPITPVYLRWKLPGIDFAPERTRVLVLTIDPLVIIQTPIILRADFAKHTSMLRYLTLPYRVPT